MKKLAKILLFAMTPLFGLCAEAFRKAEEVFKELGLDVKLIKEWSPKQKVLIFNESQEGREMYSNLIVQKGYALTPEKLTQHHALSLRRLKMKPYKKICAIYMNDTLLRGKDGDLLGFGVTPDEVYRWVLLHELRHCSAKNWKGQYVLDSERDADVSSLKALNDPKLFDAVLMFRAYDAILRPENGHDSTLYLDALQRGTPLPSAIEMVMARMEAETAVKKIVDRHHALRAGRCADTPLPACFYDVAKDTRHFSPLGKRRVELFQKALERKFPL